MFELRRQSVTEDVLDTGAAARPFADARDRGDVATFADAARHAPMLLTRANDVMKTLPIAGM
jgi:hypothetical protein